MERLADDYVLLTPHLGLRRLGAERSQVRLVFFPFLGGQSLSFKDLSRTLPATWEMWAPDPPGHGRAQGELLENFDEMIGLYLQYLDHLFQGRFYLYGHSMGGLIAWKIARALEKNGVAPRRVMVAASPVPHRVSEYENLRGMDRDQLIENLLSCGGIPQAIAARKRFLLRFMPVIEADIKIFLGARFGRELLTAPLSVFYSDGDVFCHHSIMPEWKDYASDVTWEKMEGNHIFIHSHYRAVGEKISSLVAADSDS